MKVLARGLKPPNFFVAKKHHLTKGLIQVHPTVYDNLSNPWGVEVLLRVSRRFPDSRCKSRGVSGGSMFQPKSELVFTAI
ncbi:MAG: hypothetical protein KME46_03210 [Brasilonema angustatum HA4187-MV1]|nr:hypothetical protein [Brasilonema angustatum HA4187-MV1]